MRSRTGCKVRQCFGACLLARSGSLHLKRFLITDRLLGKPRFSINDLSAIDVGNFNAVLKVDVVADPRHPGDKPDLAKGAGRNTGQINCGGDLLTTTKLLFGADLRGHEPTRYRTDVQPDDSRLWSPTQNRLPLNAVPLWSP